MTMADMAGISTVPHALIKGKTGPAYITKRVDRNISDNKIEMLAMEDFCQLDLRLTKDKYRSSYERCAKIIKQYSSRVGIDMAEFFVRIVFCFIVGIPDMHLKNFSLIETAEASGKYVLSPAYDLLPVNANMPSDQEQFALAMNGKKMNIRKGDFWSLQMLAVSLAKPPKSLSKVLLRALRNGLKCAMSHCSQMNWKIGWLK